MLKKLSERYVAFIKRSGVENIINYGIICWLCFASVNFILSNFAELIYLGAGKAVTLSLYLLTLLVSLVVFPVTFRRLNRETFLFSLAGALVVLISFYMSEAKLEYIKELRTMILRGIPLFLLFSTVKSDEKVLKNLEIIGTIMVVAGLLSVTVFRENFQSSSGAYSMFTGYQTLVASILLMGSILYKPKLITVVMLFVSVFINVLSGTRGPLLIEIGLLLMMIVYIVLNKCSKKWKFFFLAFIISIPLIFFAFSDTIEQFILDQPSLMKYSRSLRLLFSGDFFKSDARLEIFSASIDYISSNLFFGPGILNERIEIGKLVSIGTTYSHNFFLEILTQFGAIPGIFLLILFLRAILRRYILKNEFKDRLLLVILVISGIIPLLLSGSYIEWPMFYVLMGYLLNTDNFLFKQNTSDIKSQ